MIKNYIRFAVFSLFAVWLTACSKDDTDDDQPPQEVTRWECILFGSYPANEVVSGTFDAVDDYALVEGDVIVNATLFSQLENAQWTDDGITVGLTLMPGTTLPTPPSNGASLNRQATKPCC